MFNKVAPGEDRTRDLSLTKRTHYHYATEATGAINQIIREYYFLLFLLCFSSLNLTPLSSRLQQHIGGGISGLREEDVNPRLTFHYGIPTEASSMAYDPIQHILAISTR